MRVNFRITSLFAILVEKRSVKVTCAVKCRIVFFGSFELLFGKIMFVLGPGHIELNLARLLLRFLCQAFLSHFVKCLGFRTLKAQQLVLNGVDHHRSKQLLSSCFEALSKELLVSCICYCTEKGEEASNDGYQQLVDNFVDDPTYILLIL